MAMAVALGLNRTWTRSPGVGRFWVWAENGFWGFPGDLFRGDPENAFIGEVPGGVLLDMEFASNHATERGVVSLGFSASGPKTRIQHGTA